MAQIICIKSLKIPRFTIRKVVTFATGTALVIILLNHLFYFKIFPKHIEYEEIVKYSNSSLVLYEADNVPGWYPFSGKLRYSLGLIPLFTYSSTFDRVSRSLRSQGWWEFSSLAQLEVWLNRDPDLHLIDIGCHLGTWSLVAAMRGRKVVAVDANIQNLRHLRKSLQLNRIEKNVTLVYNAVSNQRGISNSLVFPEWDNVGHAIVLQNEHNSGESALNSILLDDLLSVIFFKRAMLKIDIEGQEAMAFQGGNGLLSKLNIPAVFMEWQWLKSSADKKKTESLVKLFGKFHYKAYPTLLSDYVLSENYMLWPSNIVWKKDKHFN